MRPLIKLNFISGLILKFHRRGLFRRSGLSLKFHRRGLFRRSGLSLKFHRRGLFRRSGPQVRFYLVTVTWKQPVFFSNFTRHLSSLRKS